MTRVFLKCCTLAVLCLGVLTCQGTAAGAAFSADGRWIYHLSSEKADAIAHYSFLAKPSARSASGETRFPEPLADIARLSTGQLMVASATTIWKWDPEKKEQGIEALGKVEEGQKIGWIAAHPSDGSLLIMTSTETEPLFLWQLPKGSTALRKVLSRRVTSISGLSYNARGELIFSSRGDLWHGTLDVAFEMTNLVAHRWIAVAEQETFGGTPTGKGAYATACAGGRVFVEHRRMFGSGWGSLISLPEPPKLKGDLDLPALLKEACRVSKDLWEIADTGGSAVQFATTPDGKETYYRTHQMKHFLGCEKSEPKLQRR